MDQQKTQLIQKLKDCSNILVTVSQNPSVDQLSAAIGLTLALNAAGKHATAVYSGKTPSAIEFLEPEHTIKKDTHSLRDFIISLDKEKADKLRYKVEDTMVKIFITPYRTAISDADLEFSEGDFNVEMVVAIGVREKNELDEAISSHGRILHDATVATLNTQTSGQMGSINWVDSEASSLCEMLVDVINGVKEDVFDKQIATALLTGIVAETERFSNEKTSSNTMKSSAMLMAAGADQQLVATKLQQPEEPEEPVQQDEAEDPEQEQSADGVLKVDRSGSNDSNENNNSDNNSDQSETPIFDEELPSVDETTGSNGEENENSSSDEGPDNNEEENDQSEQNSDQSDINESQEDDDSSGEPEATRRFLADDPPKTGTLTASHISEEVPNATQLNKSESDNKVLEKGAVNVGPIDDQSGNLPEATSDDSDTSAAAHDTDAYEKTMSEQVPDDQTLSSLEQAVESPHVSAGSVWPTQPKPAEQTTSSAPATPTKDSARAAIDEAMKHMADGKQAEQDDKEGALDVAHEGDDGDHGVQIDPQTGKMQYTKDVNISHDDQASVPDSTPAPSADAQDQAPVPPRPFVPPQPADDEQPFNPTAPPPVPPPMMPPQPNQAQSGSQQNSQDANQQPLPPVNY